MSERFIVHVHDGCDAGIAFRQIATLLEEGADMTTNLVVFKDGTHVSAAKNKTSDRWIVWKEDEA